MLGSRNTRTNAVAAVVVSALAALLVACEPPPPPDGRDLGWTINDTRVDITPGETVTTRLTLINWGTAKASGIRVSYIAPPNVRIDAVTVQGGTCAASDNPQRWDCTAPDLQPYGWLAPGSTVPVTVTFTGLTEGPAALHVLSTDSDAGEPTPDTRDNLVGFPIAVGPGSKVDLKVETAVTGPGGQGISVGGTAKLTSQVSTPMNPYPGAPYVMGLTLTQEVDPRFAIESVAFKEITSSGQVGSCDVVELTISCDTDGQNFTRIPWELVATLRPISAGPFTTTATVASPHPEHAIYPNTVSTTGTIYGSAFGFDPVEVGPVPVGSSFTMDATWASGGYAMETTVYVPAGVRFDGLQARTGSAAYTSVTCAAATGPATRVCAVGFVPPVDLRLQMTALATADNAAVRLKVYAAEVTNMTATGYVDIVPAP